MVRAHVLCTGREYEVLKSRCDALKQEFSHVASARTLKETGRKFLSGKFDVVVFCSTIPKEEQAATAEVIRMVRPTTKIVALSEAEEWRPYADDTVLGSNHRALAATCADLICQHSRRFQ
jgi:DNA-binding NarL/FixJ family response regulator